MVKTAAGAGLDQHIAAGEGEGVGVLVCEPLVRRRRAGRHLLEHLWLAASADLGISPARSELIGQSRRWDYEARAAFTDGLGRSGPPSRASGESSFIPQNTCVCVYDQQSQTPIMHSQPFGCM